jgi:ribonuclease VapC
MDASAVLALLNNEPGSEIVLGLMNDAVISTVNLAEVVTRLSTAGMPEAAIRESLDLLGMETADFDEELIILAGLLGKHDHACCLSLGDRACLALALQRKAPAVTANRMWKNLDLQVSVQLIR